MTLAELYPYIKTAHVGLAVASGTLFAARGVAGLAGSTIGMRGPVRHFSYALDTALLAAALLLLATLRLNPFVTPWLAAKLTVLVVYIVLGSLALKRARTRRGRIAAFAGALACFAMMYAIARRHDPLGFLDFFRA